MRQLLILRLLHRPGGGGCASLLLLLLSPEWSCLSWISNRHRPTHYQHLLHRPSPSPSPWRSWSPDARPIRPLFPPHSLNFSPRMNRKRRDHTGWWAWEDGSARARPKWWDNRREWGWNWHSPVLLDRRGDCLFSKNNETLNPQVLLNYQRLISCYSEWRILLITNTLSLIAVKYWSNLINLLNGNPADENRRGAACWKWLIFAFKDKKPLFFRILSCFDIGWINFSSLKNIKTSGTIFQDFSPGGRTFRSSIQDG